MGTNLMKKFLLAAVAISTLSASANAAVIVDLPGGTPLPIPVRNTTNTTDPLVLAPGVVASPAPGARFTPGYTGGYGFSSNGFWSGISMIGLDRPTGYFTIDFASPISAFLGELNWTTGNASNGSIEIYGLNGLLESLTLESNGANAVAPGFRGFSRATNEITSVRFNNEYIGVRNISTLSAAAVPEPATWLMMILGFAAIGGTMRRRQRVTAQIRFA
jgi:opacity protein-like surface antigen